MYIFNSIFACVCTFNIFNIKYIYTCNYNYIYIITLNITNIHIIVKYIYIIIYNGIILCNVLQSGL